MEKLFGLNNVVISLKTKKSVVNFGLHSFSGWQ